MDRVELGRCISVRVSETGASTLYHSSTSTTNGVVPQIATPLKYLIERSIDQICDSEVR